MPRQLTAMRRSLARRDGRAASSVRRRSPWPGPLGARLAPIALPLALTRGKPRAGYAVPVADLVAVQRQREVCGFARPAEVAFSVLGGPVETEDGNVQPRASRLRAGRG